MDGLTKRLLMLCLLVFLFPLCHVTGIPVATASEVGEPAPAFTMPSTTGTDISLSDFRGKKWVLLEFYGADFAPT